MIEHRDNLLEKINALIEEIENCHTAKYDTADLEYIYKARVAVERAKDLLLTYFDETPAALNLDQMVVYTLAMGKYIDALEGFKSVETYHAY